MSSCSGASSSCFFLHSPVLAAYAFFAHFVPFFSLVFRPELRTLALPSSTRQRFCVDVKSIVMHCTFLLTFFSLRHGSIDSCVHSDSECVAMDFCARLFLFRHFTAHGLWLTTLICLETAKRYIAHSMRFIFLKRIGIKSHLFFHFTS